jgi:hypothetical protein
MNLLLLFVLASPAGSAPAAAPPVLFRLYFAFQVEPPAAIRHAIQEEVDSIMSPIGWRIHWTYLNPEASREWSTDLAVMRFKGRCEVDPLPSEPVPNNALGATSVTDGKVSPFGVVYCDAVRRFVAPLLALLPGVRREAVFGRALGRVLAHELNHIINRSQRHAPKGLGRAGLSPEELMANDFRFSESDIQRLRIRLLPLVLRSSDWMSRPEKGRGLSIFVLGGCAGCHGVRAEGTPWGPALTRGVNFFDPLDLATKLRRLRSGMQKRVSTLHRPRRRMNLAELRAVTLYLNGLTRNQASGSGSRKEDVLRPVASPLP